MDTLKESSIVCYRENRIQIAIFVHRILTTNERRKKIIQLLNLILNRKSSILTVLSLFFSKIFTSCNSWENILENT